MKDYVLAVKACLKAFRREAPLQHDGPYYKMSLLPEQWTPPRHEHEDVKVDISAVGPIMVRVAGEVADGVHVHPMHSMHYINNRLLPGVAEGARRAGRDPSAIDLIIPVIVAAGDTPEERANPILEAKTTIGFYGATPNYAFQFDDLGHTGMRDKLRDCLRAGDNARVQALITDEILDQFAVVARWDDVADRMIERYKGIASRLVIYLASHWREIDRQDAGSVGRGGAGGEEGGVMGRRSGRLRAHTALRMMRDAGGCRVRAYLCSGSSEDLLRGAHGHLSHAPQADRGCRCGRRIPARGKSRHRRRNPP